MPNGCRNWVWTLNNYTEHHLQALQDLGENLTSIVYLVYGKETGESGTPHLQGFVQLSGKKTLKQAKSILPGNPHLEMMKGTAEEAASYCKKDGDFKEYGTMIKKGQRTDLKQIQKEIDEGATYEQLWDKHFNQMIQYRKGFAEYFDLKRSKLHREPPRVFVFYGCTGTGKTRRAWAIDPTSTWVYPGKGWFDGYIGQRVAIFDEFDGGDILFSLWKQLVDRYPVRVPVKGGFTSWTPSIIVFTSNIPPHLWWKQENLPQGHTDQFNRRVERVLEMNEPWDPETEPLNFI